MFKHFAPIIGSILLFFGAQTTVAQTYPFARLTGAPLDTTGWFLAGDAQIGDTQGDTNSLNDELILVRPVNTRSGACFFKKPINITSCQKWTAEFDFRMWEGSAADGIAFFFLNNPPETFITGGGMGIPPKPLGLMVCFDTWQNCNVNSTGRIPKIQIRYGNGIQNYSECPSPPQPTVSEVRGLRSPTYNHAKIVYDFGSISVFLNDTLRLTGNYNIQFAGYFGMTASTGGSNDRHSIKDFVLYTQKPLLVAPNAGPDQTLCNGATSNIGSLSGGNNYTYLWYPTTGLSDSSSQHPQVTLENTGSTPYTIKYFVTKDTVGVGEPRCAFADDVKITVLPRLNQANKNILLCSKTPTNIGFNPITAATYSWNPATYLTTAVGSNPIFSSISMDTVDEEFVYAVTASHPAGCLETDTVRVKRLGRFADAGSDLTLCGSDTINLGGSVKSEYNYSWFMISPPSPGFQSSISDPQGGKTKAFISISDTVPVSIKFRQIVLRQDLNCRNDDTIQVKVFPIPKSRVLPSVSVCPLQIVPIGGPSGSGFQFEWMHTIGILNPQNALTQLTGQQVSSSFDTTYFRKRFWTDLPGCFSFDSAAIRFKRNPDIFKTADKSICPNDSVVLGFGEPQVGYSYNWDPAVFLDTTSKPVARFFAGTSENDTIQYVLTNTLESCEIKDTVLVKIFSKPIFPALATFPVCSGIPKIFGPDSTSGYLYTWLNTMGLSSPLVTRPFLTLTYNLAQSGSERIYPIRSVDQSTFCFRTDTIRILLQPFPEVFAGNDRILCSGDTILLGNPSAPGSDIYSWFGNGDFSDPDKAVTRFIRQGNQPEIIKISLIQTNAFGCPAYDTVNIQFRPIPAPTIGQEGKTFVCLSDSAFFYTHGVTQGSVYSWDIFGGDTIGAQTGVLMAQWFNNPAGLQLKEKDGFGCIGYSDTLSITVSPKPVGILSGPDFVCPWSFQKTYSLSGTAFIASAFADGNLVNHSSTDRSINVAFDSTGTIHRLIIIPKTETGCLGDTLFKTVNLDVVIPELLSASVVESGSVQLKMKPFPSQYSSSVDISEGGPSLINQDVTGKATFIVSPLPTQKPLFVRQTVIDQCGISRSSSVHQTIAGSASADIRFNELHVDCKWSEYLGGIFPVNYELFRWNSMDNEFQTVAKGPFLNSAIHSFPINEKPVFKVLATWTRNMESLESWSDKFELNVQRPPLEIPNLITPNGDDKNEVLEISYLYWYANPALRIYNRWGAQVYFSSNYQNDWKPDNSTEGLYFYELSSSGNNWKGWISVVK